MKYCVIKHLILLKIQIMVDINVDLLQWSITLLIKRILESFLKNNSGSGIKNGNILNKELAEDLHKPIVFLKEKYTHLL